MANASLVQVKVDEETKADVTNLYESLGLDLPTAVRIFSRRALPWAVCRLNCGMTRTDGMFTRKRGKQSEKTMCPK